jgi:hypothetical protein
VTAQAAPYGRELQSQAAEYFRSIGTPEQEVESCATGYLHFVHLLAREAARQVAEELAEQRQPAISNI